METPQFIGRYEIISRVGRGGMAEVFLARRGGAAGFGKRVAIKRLLADKVLDRAMIRSLINEAHLAANLSHPTLVQVFEFEQIDGDYCLVMEFVDGITLHTLLNRCRERGLRIPRPLQIHISARVCAALDYAHGACAEDGTPLNMIHRDIKPSNIMLSRSGQVKLMDFGVARSAVNPYKTTSSGKIKGTLCYMSPEQINGKHALSPASDLFSLGTILYEMATLDRLFDDTNVFRLAFTIQRGLSDEAHHALADVFPDLIPVLERFLAPEPEDRVGEAREALRILRAMNLGGSDLDLRDFLEEAGVLGDEEVITRRERTDMLDPLAGDDVGEALPPVLDFGLDGAGEGDSLSSKGKPSRRSTSSLVSHPGLSSIQVSHAADPDLESDVRGAVSLDSRPSSSVPPGDARRVPRTLEYRRPRVDRAAREEREEMERPKKEGARPRGVQGADGGANGNRSVPEPSDSRPDSREEPPENPRGSGGMELHFVGPRFIVGILAVVLVLVGLTMGVGVWRTRVQEPFEEGTKHDAAVASMVESETVPIPAGSPLSSADEERDVGHSGGEAGRAHEPVANAGAKKRRVGRSKSRRRDARKGRTGPAPKARGRLTLNSIPYSEVFVDAESRGYSPFTGEVEAGRHRVLLITADGRRKAFVVQVPPGGTLTRVWSFSEGTWVR